MTPMGSRRIHEVWPRMYSPVERPSSTRAAPAKNRIWSSIGGTSSLAVRALGLPVFSPSRRTKSSARASTAAANFSSASWRSRGVVRPHSPNALEAAAYARSTSSCPETAAEATTLPVAGLTTSLRASVVASTNCPPMWLRSTRGESDMSSSVELAVRFPVPDAVSGNVAARRPFR